MALEFSPKSIALFRLSAIGDILMYLPTVRALQKAFPHCQLTWFISQPAYDLVKNIEGIEFVLIDKPRGLKDYWKYYKQFKNRHFDVLIASQANYRVNFFYPLIKATRKIGYDNIRGQSGHRWFVHEKIPFRQVHTLEGFMQFAEHLGVNCTQVEWNLSLEPSALAWVKSQLKYDINDTTPLVVINPAASKPERSWSAERYIKVIQYLQQHYQARVILCGGPLSFDRQLADVIQSHVRVEDWVGKTRIPQLLALISKAQLVICPDTGPSHMAAALGVPVIALHGVTKPEISGPYGQLNNTINVYPEARAKFMNKKREKNANQWFLKVHHPEVMNLIHVDAVCQKIDEIFKS